ARYDAAIPTFEQVLGHGPGERIVSHAELLDYVDALAAAAPDRMRVWDYGETWEGRRMVYLAVGSPRNVGRLEEIRLGMQALADPRATVQDRAEALIAELPAVIWLGYGVHGNEISSPDAALFLAYHLLAAQGDATVDAIREDVLVLIDPLQNPDGRDRFVHGFRQSYGIRPDPDRLAAEHDEPWPGGRTNHYLFDLNRDWFALTQPETRGRVAVLQEWYPLVFVDLHEMGGDSTYYFAPEAVPYNPHLAQDQRDSLELFGRNNAKWFDEFGFDYFTREIYDAFYPGYGASWPAYYGAVAMTYEQASPRGLVLLRTDGELLHFREAVRHHFVASVSTAETAARHREKLLRDFWDYRRTAIEEGRGEGELVLAYRGDTAAVDKLAGLLAAQGVEVRRTIDGFESCGVSYPAGSYLIDLAQPSKRLVRNLLDPEVLMEEDFVAEQERRRELRLGDQIYDVTAWSLPLQFGVEAARCAARRQRPARAETEAITPDLVRPGSVRGGPDAEVAYLVPWGTAASSRLLLAALGQGLVPLSPDASFTQNGRVYLAGTLVFKVDDNPQDLGDRLRELAVSTGAEVVATDQSWVEEGVNWGSRRVVKLRPPRIALAWDSPVSSYSAGAARYVLERQYGYPVTVIRVDTLANADLRRYHVLVLPDTFGGYDRALGEDGSRRLVDWVAAGGTLVAIGSAVEWAAGEDVGLLATATEPKAGSENDDAPGEILETAEEYRKAIRPETEPPDNVAGVLLRARVDPEHWLAAGLPEVLHVLVSGRDIFSPVPLDEGVNVAVYAGPDELLASGYLWDENRRQLAFKPFAISQPHGRGEVIAFTSDPNVRAYLDGLNLIFLNAIFRGSAHANPVVW
ncbi:MAG TPA: M14 family metallopeptidase, partial [Thermoanaerobaculia bacterium]|nr:M14 family metallopeptidase [Thermoanaerobaculia bacterium]